MDNTEAVEKLAEIIERDTSYVMYGTVRANTVAQAILAAIQADPLAYVKPKPLIWSAGHNNSHHSWTSKLGKYTVGRNVEGVGRRVSFIDTVIGFEPTLEAAQAAAYEDLCNRVGELF